MGCVGDRARRAGWSAIFSERDALLKLGTDAASLGDHPVSEFMTANPKTLRADAKIAFAVRHMDQGGFRHLPIVNDANEPVGVLSVRDILRYVAARMGVACRRRSAEVKQRRIVAFRSAKDVLSRSERRHLFRSSVLRRAQANHDGALAVVIGGSAVRG